MDPQPVSFKEEELDLRRTLKILQKWSRVIIIGTILSVAIAGVLNWFVLPVVYEASAMLMVTQPAEKERVVTQKDGLEEVVQPLSRPPQMTINTYIGQLTAPELLERVIKKLKLDPMYTPASLAGMITTKAIKESNLIEVKVRNTDPVLAATIADTLCQEFLQLISEKNQEQMTRSVAFLKTQQKECDAKLTQALAALKQYESRPPNYTVLEEGFKQKSELLASYQAELSAARVEEQQLQAAVDSLRSKLAETPRTVTTRTYEGDRGYVGSEQVNPLYVDLAQRLNERNTSLVEKQARISALAALITGLSGDLERLQGELSAKRNQLERLQSEVKRLQDTSNQLAEKLTETQIARSLDLGATNVLVVSAAKRPQDPVKPDKKLNLAVAFALGIMVFTALSFLLEHLDYTVKTPEDVSQNTGLAVMGVIPLADRRVIESSTYD